MGEQTIRGRFAGGRLHAFVGLTVSVIASVIVSTLGLLAASPTVFAAGPKYYFELHEVESRVPINGDLRTFVGATVREELASRPEWASELGGAKGRDAVVAELGKRKLAGFDVIVKVAHVKAEVKEPNPGSRLKRLSVSVRLSVLGTTLPGEKIAFGGEGEAGAEAEVPDSRLDRETESMTKDAIKDAVKQAVDQAVLKLGAPKSVPFNESKRKRKKG